MTRFSPHRQPFGDLLQTAGLVWAFFSGGLTPRFLGFLLCGVGRCPNHNLGLSIGFFLDDLAFFGLWILRHPELLGERGTHNECK